MPHSPPAASTSQLSPAVAPVPAPSLKTAFKPPQNYGMQELDRAKFDVNVPIVSVRLDTSKIGPLRKHPAMRGQIMDLPKIRGISSDPDDETKKLLRLRVQSEDQLPDATRRHLLNEGGTFLDDEITLGYEYWSTNDILAAILPASEVEEIPSSFTLTGHIGHVNLREEWLPYKHLIGQVILDKNKNLRTVVNKLNSIHAQYRYFEMEVIAGEEDYITTASESGCSFKFDFSRVYWNSRLGHEHERVVSILEPGEVVADVMAGVGPFAIPAAKKGCFVLGNDLNPESVKWMRENRMVNKVENTLRVTEEDGRAFIKSAPLEAWRNPFPPFESRTDQKKRQREERHRRDQLKLATTSGPSKSADSESASKKEQSELPISQLQGNPPQSSSATGPAQPSKAPQFISHYIMNLPDSALEFLDAYRGSYTPLLSEPNFSGKEKTPMPLIHTHCFTRELEREKASLDICSRASTFLGHTVTPEIEGFNLHLVRSVAPNKDMYCLTFRLPREVAFV